jgi:hypothetical protein
MHYIFIASCTMHFSWSVSCFCFQFYFCFICCNKCWITLYFGERLTPFFIAKNTLVFTLSFNECSLFPLLHLAFVFRLDFCLDLVISLHQGVFGPLVYVYFPQKSCFEKV